MLYSDSEKRRARYTMTGEEYLRNYSYVPPKPASWQFLCICGTTCMAAIALIVVAGIKTVGL